MGSKAESPAAVDAYEPPTCIRVTKAQAGQVSIGERVKITVAGEVKGIRESYSISTSGKDSKVKEYEIELKGSSVSSISAAGMKGWQKDIINKLEGK